MGTQVVADRYLYASLAGAGIAAAGAIRAIERRDRSLALLLGSGLAAVLFTLTVFRVPVWRDDVTLFGDAVTSDPLSGIMHRYYGRALAEAGRLEEGEWELRRAAVLLSAPAARGRWLFPIVLGEIALICETRGDLAEARALHAAAFTAAGPLEIDVAAVAYATFLEHRGEIDEARRVLREALARAKADAPKVSARLLELDGQKP
jgi:tetratricopeptide (TPR) repeat protein